MELVRGLRLPDRDIRSHLMNFRLQVAHQSPTLGLILLGFSSHLRVDRLSLLHIAELLLEQRRGVGSIREKRSGK